MRIRLGLLQAPDRLAHCWGNMVGCRGSTLFLLSNVQEDGGWMRIRLGLYQDQVG